MPRKILTGFKWDKTIPKVTRPIVINRFVRDVGYPPISVPEYIADKGEDEYVQPGLEETNDETV